MTDAKVSVVLKINFGMVIKQLASFFFSCETICSHILSEWNLCCLEWLFLSTSM